MLPRPQLALFRSPRSTFPLRVEVLFSRGVVAPQRWATLCCAAQPSAVCAQISPPFWVATEHRVEFPALYSRFHRSSAPCTAMYTHQPLSPNPPHAPRSPFGVYTFVFYVCLYFCLANRFICTIFLDSKHVC